MEEREGFNTAVLSYHVPEEDGDKDLDGVLVNPVDQFYPYSTAEMLYTNEFMAHCLEPGTYHLFLVSVDHSPKSDVVFAASTPYQTLHSARLRTMEPEDLRKKCRYYDRAMGRFHRNILRESVPLECFTIHRSCMAWTKYGHTHIDETVLKHDRIDNRDRTGDE